MTAWVQRFDGPFWAVCATRATPASPASCSASSRAFVALPPITRARSVWPSSSAIAAAVLGLWAATRGLRRLGWGAVAAGLIGIGARRPRHAVERRAT